MPLRLERGLKTREQIVEGVAQLPELLVGVVEGEAFVQVGGRDPAGGRRNRPDRPQHPAGDEPAEQYREHGDDGQGDPGVDEQVMEVGCALRRQLPRHCPIRRSEGRCRWAPRSRLRRVDRHERRHAV